jgi:uncharacterized coiled-coil protein SlyX
MHGEAVNQIHSEDKFNIFDVIKDEMEFTKPNENKPAAALQKIKELNDMCQEQREVIHKQKEQLRKTEIEKHQLEKEKKNLTTEGGKTQMTVSGTGLP